MKRIVIILLTGLIYISPLKAIKIEGKIIYGKDTTEVIFKIPKLALKNKPDYAMLQNQIIYFDSTGKKKVLLPDRADEITFTYNNMEIRMFSVLNTLNLGSSPARCDYLFLKLEIYGKLKMYHYYSFGSRGGCMGCGTSGSSEVILQKRNEELVSSKMLTFRKEMIEYFDDCPELAKKIESKELQKKDIEVIVDYYNLHCGDQ